MNLIANRRTLDTSQVVIAAVAALFFAVCTWTSYARWANFEYRTFDLAYYVQAIWQLIHGRFQVSVEPVPLQSGSGLMESNLVCLARCCSSLQPQAILRSTNFTLRP